MMRQPNELPAALKSIDVKAMLRKRGVFRDLRLNQENKAKALPLAKAMLAKKKVKQPEPQKYAHVTNDKAIAFWEKQIRIVEVVEARFEKKVEQFVVKIVNEFLKHLTTEVESQKGLKKFNTKDYFDEFEDALQVQAQFDFTPLLMDQVVHSGQEAYKLIDHDDVYIPYKIRDKISANVRKFTDSMIHTDRDTLINIIDNGITDGKSVPEIRTQIETTFEGISKTQAQRVTRTEVLRASNQATEDAYKQSGVVEGKQWLTAGAVDECAPYDGKIVGLGKDFYSSNNEFEDGDPPLHPNCRCVILPVLVDEKGYVPEVNAKLYDQIKELEAKVDKRTKAYKELQALRTDDEVYIKSLEKHLGLEDE